MWLLGLKVCVTIIWSVKLTSGTVSGEHVTVLIHCGMPKDSSLADVLPPTRRLSVVRMLKSYFVAVFKHIIVSFGGLRGLVGVKERR